MVYSVVKIQVKGLTFSWLGINPFTCLKWESVFGPGAASGMGRETSIVLSKLGAELILVDIDEQGLNVTAEMLENKYYVLINVQI